MNLYTDNDEYCCDWLHNLVAERLLPPGDVLCTDIKEFKDAPQGYDQVHWFCGIGGWPLALKLAGWPDDRPVWTGSCPCQPFSVAGKGKGAADERHLWPYFHRLIRAARPPVVMGEQVSGAAGYGWLDGVRADLEGEGYAVEAVDIPACGVGAPHIRNRLYWVANSQRGGCWPGGIGRSVPAVSGPSPDDTVPVEERSAGRDWVADANCPGRREAESEQIGRAPTESGSDGQGSIGVANTQYGAVSAWSRDAGWQSGERTSERSGPASASGATGGVGDTASVRCERMQEGICGGDLRPQPQGNGRGGWTELQSSGAGFWSDYTLVGPDPKGRYRRVKPGVRLLASGVPARVSKLRALGNAIVPPLAVEVIRAWMETEGRSLQHR